MHDRFLYYNNVNQRMKANIDNHHKVSHGSDPIQNKTI